MAHFVEGFVYIFTGFTAEGYKHDGIFLVLLHSSQTEINDEMLKCILIAKKKLPCNFWSRVLTDANYQTLSCWTSVDDAVRETTQNQPDLLLTEIDFAANQGFETARQAIAARPGLRCIMALPAEVIHYTQSVQTDISGYLPHDMDDPAELLTCIAQISQGYRYISPVFWDALQSPSSQHMQLISGLTDRRKQVLRLVAKGLTARQIGLEMNIAEATVRHYKEEISKLLGLSGTHQLKIFAGSVAHLLG